MKNIFVLITSLFVIECSASILPNPLAIPTYTTIVKSNGGFRGYKTVDESSNGVNKILACADPGKLKCVFSKTGSSNLLTQEEFDDIDNTVYNLIYENQFSGKFHYRDKVLVVYSYNEINNNIEYTIYTKEEAKNLGYDI